MDIAKYVQEDNAEGLGRKIFAHDTDNELLKATLLHCLGERDYAFLFRVIKECNLNINYSLKKYTSIREASYSHKQRVFDRFIEMLNHCDIDSALYLPFIIEAVNPALDLPHSVFSAPATEFLINFAKSERGFRQTFELISQQKDFYLLYDILIFANKTEAIRLLCDKIFEDRLNRFADYKGLIRSQKEYLLPLVLAKLDDGANREVVYRILLLFKNEVQIRNILKDFFTSEENIKLRALLGRELKLSYAQSFLDRAEMEDFCRAQNKRTDLSKLDLKYKDGASVPAYVQHMMTYAIVNGFLDYVHEIARFIDEDNLMQEAAALAEGFSAKSKPDIISFALYFGGEKAANSVIKTLKGIVLMPKRDEKNYLGFIELLALSKTREAGEFLEKIMCAPYASKAAKKCALDAFNAYADNLQCDPEELTDARCDEFIGIKIDENLNISMDLDEITPFFSNLSTKEEELKRQIDRFYDSFVRGRKYTKPSFEVVLKKKVLCKIAETLFFGVYSASALIDVFVVHEGKTCDLKGEPFILNDQMIIKILHPIDLTTRFSHLKTYDGFQPFNQLGRQIYPKTREDILSNRVARFNGLFTSSEFFLGELAKGGFAYGEDIEGRGVCFKIVDGILIEGEVSKNQIEARLGIIRFFDADTISKANARYLTSKPLEIAKMDDRFFSESLLEIAKLFSVLHKSI